MPVKTGRARVAVSMGERSQFPAFNNGDEVRHVLKALRRGMLPQVRTPFPAPATGIKREGRIFFRASACAK